MGEVAPQWTPEQKEKENTRKHWIMSTDTGERWLAKRKERRGEKKNTAWHVIVVNCKKLRERTESQGKLLLLFSLGRSSSQAKDRYRNPRLIAQDRR